MSQRSTASRRCDSASGAEASQSNCRASLGSAGGASSPLRASAVIGAGVAFGRNRVRMAAARSRAVAQRSCSPSHRATCSGAARARRSGRRCRPSPGHCRSAQVSSPGRCGSASTAAQRSIQARRPDGSRAASRSVGGCSPRHRGQLPSPSSQRRWPACQRRRSSAVTASGSRRRAAAIARVLDRGWSTGDARLRRRPLAPADHGVRAAAVPELGWFRLGGALARVEVWRRRRRLLRPPQAGRPSEPGARAPAVPAAFGSGRRRSAAWWSACGLRWRRSRRRR
jgi:hypothetical protein